MTLEKNMRALWLSLILTLGLPGVARPAEGGTRDERFAAARAVYAQRAALAKHKEAAAAFAKLAADFPDDRDLQLWCARTAYYAAHRVEDAKEKQAVSMRGVRCAKRMKQKDPTDYDGRYWWIMDRYKGESAKGVLDVLTEAAPVKEYLLGMIKSQPRRFEAYMIVGAIYRELPGPPVAFGDPDKGLRFLQQGAKYAPDDAELLLELAQAYRSLGQTDKARATYKRCIHEGKGRPDLEWETQDAKDYAKKMLAELD